VQQQSQRPQKSRPHGLHERIIMSAKNQSAGTLVVIGGDEQKPPGGELLEHFLALSGGAEADIAVMTCASRTPERTGIEHERVFRDLGAARTNVIHTSDCEGSSPRALAVLRRTSGIFFVGGQPDGMIDAIKGTSVEKLLHARYESGCVIGGMNAGALLMQEVVMMDGESEGRLGDNNTVSRRGLGLLKQVLLDVHFAGRGRCGRMLSMLARHPDCVGFGIDEDTAMVFRRDACQVVGQGAVLVFDASSPNYQNLTDPASNSVALADVRLHVLPAPRGFHLGARLPC
jgi:cyanophycinase